MSKDYFEVRDWLESFIPEIYSKKNLGLERIAYLLKFLDNPEKKFKSVHVGGTSGKGSTAFYISEFLQLKKLKVGLHISPHLIYLGERMQINGKEISVSRFVGLINQIKPFVEQMRASQVGFPSYFEILVAASFKYFADEKVDITVVEVGLGGEYDATNVLKPNVSVITNVGLDHMDILGKTIEKIASEKSGIIKKNVPILTGTSGKAFKIIEKRAKENNSKLITINTLLSNKSVNTDVLKAFNVDKYSLGAKSNKLAYSNKLLALMTVDLLGMQISQKDMNKIFSKLLKGRMEEIQKGVILDGAHNLDKINFLIQWIKKQMTTNDSQLIFENVFNKSNVSGQTSNVTLVLAFKKGKNWKKMVDLLIKRLPVKKVIAAEFFAVTDTGKFMAVNPEEIKKYIDSKWSIKVESFENSQEAVFEALNSTQLPNYSTTQPILITGSLYFVGEVRTLWKSGEF